MNTEVRIKERPLSVAVAERRATPNFDGSPIPDDILASILKAGMEAPSASNIQPWRFIVVRDLEQKRRLREAAMGQLKVEEASAVIVFCGDPKAALSPMMDKVFAEGAKHGFTAEQNAKAKENLQKTFNSAPGNAMGLAPDFAVWVNRHVMIAFTTMMWTAETLGYDTAPMEGFFEDKVKATLGIPEGIRVVALLGIGKLQGPDKPYAGRLKMEDVCFKEKWGESLSL